MSQKTPDNGKSGGRSFDKLYSPSAKRSLQFDLFDEASYLMEDSPSPAKQVKVQKEMLIKDLGSNPNVCETIKFRVTNMKFTIAHGGQGKETLRFYAYDGSKEILIVCWNEMAIKINNEVKVNDCCSLKNFLVAEEDPKYPSYSGHSHYIKIIQGSSFEKINEDLPRIPFNFVGINDVSNVNVDSMIDVLAVVGLNRGLEPGNKRNLILTEGPDQGPGLLLTIYDQVAQDFGDDSNLVIAVRKALVCQMEGVKVLRARGSTLVWKSPSIQEAERLEPVMEKIKIIRENVVARQSTNAKIE